MYVYMYMCIYLSCRAANKGWWTVNCCQFLALEHPYLSSNNHCDWWIFQEVFFLVIIIVIYERFFWTILNLFSWNLNIYKTHRKSVLFPFFCYTDSQTELIRLFNFFTREAFKLIKCIVLCKILPWGIQPFRTIF